MAEREEPRVPGTTDHQRDKERRFAALYQAYYRPILAYAVRRVEAAEDAADVVADVFTIAWRRIDELPDAPADRLWLYGVAQRVVAGRRRSARRLGRLIARLRANQGARALIHPAPGQLPAGQAGLPDATSERVMAALGRLSPAEREALQLVLWEELSHADAAQVLGCSANAVAIRVHRAKTRLRGELSATEPSPTGRAATGRAGTERAATGMSDPRSVPATTPARTWTNRS
jgi:RNA polymerase sigma-70 factor, ECF subfamily